MSVRKRYRLNVVGVFYVDDECCNLCGIARHLAPELFDEVDDSCFVKRQPKTFEELGTMLKVMSSSGRGVRSLRGIEEGDH